MAFTLKQATKQTSFGAQAQDISKLQKITCILTNFIYKDEESGFFVFAAQVSEGEQNASGMVNGKKFTGRKFAVVGTSLIMTQSVVEGQEVEVWGDFEPGKQPNSIQFSAVSIQEKIPTKPKAIELFLSSGKIYGIGPKTAKKIVNEFGPRTIKILDEDPNLLLSIEGVSQKKLEMIKQSWNEWRSVYEIVATMRLYGIGDAAGVKIFNHFKEKSIYIIKNEPYDLTEVETIGFKTADKIAQQLGKSPIDEKRVEKCLLYKIEEISDSGHTAFPKDELAFKTNELLRIDPTIVIAKIEDLIAKGLLIEKPIKIKNYNNNKTSFTIISKDGVAHSKIHNTEVRIAKELKRIIEFPFAGDQEKSRNNIYSFLKTNPYKLDESQLEAAKTILLNKVSILTGGPGTGKTHTITSLLHYFDSIGKQTFVLIEDEEDKVGLNSVLAAPTGRAAKRMEEATRKGSSTMHRLLGFKEGQFVHNETNRLVGDVFIVDEASMIDIWLQNGFLKAVPSDAIVIFVGDIDQLESVGAGNVLKDMIDSEYIPVARLKIPHRQALNSKIIVASHAIINRQLPPIEDINSDSDFIFVEKEGNEEIHNSIMDIITDLVKSGISCNDIQVLSPKKESAVGTYSLNTTLRSILNPQFFKYKDMDSRFVPGDRVMQFKNNRELDIYNGDIGFVDYVDKENSSLNINFDNKDIEISGQDISNLHLSYAITIHKSQGSDYPYVIIPLSKSHSFMWDANLLYTAVTRGKKKVILVGEKKTLFTSVSSFKQKERITGLKDEIVKVFTEINNVKQLMP
jgi:exodeoxyribonuclease V alpha subunit